MKVDLVVKYSVICVVVILALTIICGLRSDWPIMIAGLSIGVTGYLCTSPYTIPNFVVRIAELVGLDENEFFEKSASWMFPVNYIEIGVGILLIIIGFALLLTRKRRVAELKESAEEIKKDASVYYEKGKEVVGEKAAQIKENANATYNRGKEYASEKANSIKKETLETVDAIKNSDNYKQVKNFASESANQIKEKTEKVSEIVRDKDKLKSSINDIKKSSSEMFNSAKETVSNKMNQVKDSGALKSATSTVKDFSTKAGLFDSRDEHKVDMLLKYKELLDKGAITEEEFNEKKKEYL